MCFFCEEKSLEKPFLCFLELIPALESPWSPIYKILTLDLLRPIELQGIAKVEMTHVKWGRGEGDVFVVLLQGAGEEDIETVKRARKKGQSFAVYKYKKVGRNGP
ncbi:hypothetical protein Tco_0783103 [Tanacetum coccineum]